MGVPEDDSRHTAIREDVAQLFRAEALEQYQRGETDEAHLLEVESRWMRHADRIVLALLAAAVAVGVAMRGFSLMHWRRRRIPLVRQVTETDCAAACLTMVLAHHGKTLRLDDRGAEAQRLRVASLL